MTQASFPTAPDKAALERGEVLSPRFDANGLVAVVATHAQTGEVLMVGYMNAEALARTLELGEAVYYSRSRGEIWHKGATSGQIQKIVEMRVDCDQDCLWIKVLPQGDGGACHVGFRSCFYRTVEDGKLVERP
ncbi:MAG: phosphoribosyl-AMP cyclohydrolase [Phenylobacterium sp.]|uniref:phosphoribosyl-AMP cyclohydrolase n=1 Tax=Phenylobacterium sp. TaxID=1871053 RepID=UPI0025E11C0F|nr:phosphoribosyl-AMP cyclohydrolase [Phenylobacterium sp.]MBA4013215.1 phosphoribosyl-AMP cyclohydrolase [Phenylobacterium sp.]